jgi:hypothetical protein
MRAAVLAAVLPCLIAAFYASAPNQGTCSSACDKAAASCVDDCEAKFPKDPASRVGCKVECGKQRASCESACGH